MPYEQYSQLAEKWVVVTGSSGGIGSAIAREFARCGANLIVHGHRHRDALESLANELRSGGTQVEVIAGDLADPAALPGFLASCWKIAPIDVLVNNAGFDALTGSAADLPFAEKLEHLWTVDVRATVELSRAFGEKMKSHGSGAILNMGWDQAEVGMAGESGELFATAKGAIMCFTRSLAKSLAPQVRVNCIAPGWIRTAWGEQASQYWQQRAAAESLMNRWGTPEDVARVSRFLASADASFLTGQVIHVNGGRSGNVDGITSWSDS